MLLPGSAGARPVEIVLDFDNDIRVDANNPALLHAHAIEAHRLGLQHLAIMVREREQQYIDASPYPSGGAEVMEDLSYFDPVLYCAFNWFSITLTSYLRLVCLIDLVNRHGWALPDLLTNAKEVDDGCRAYIESIAPAVLRWRNKVAAHPAATAPIGHRDRRGPDQIGTLLQSYSCPITRVAGYFEVGRSLWSIDGQSAALLPWSLTWTYERLTPRFWPDLSIKPHQHRAGEAPEDRPGTYLRLVRSTL